MPTNSKRLFIQDVITNRPFLIDPGSDISTIKSIGDGSPVGIASAANGTQRLTIDLKLRRRFTFIFRLAFRFGVPAIVTTDRGLLFQSQLFRELGDTFGIKHIQTSAYNPRANEIVERFHRQMKDAHRAKSSDLNWHQDLPLILLSIRCSNKEDLGYSPAKMTYGQELRFPPDPYQLEHRVQPVEDFIRALTKSIPGDKADKAKSTNQRRQSVAGQPQDRGFRIRLQGRRQDAIGKAQKEPLPSRATLAFLRLLLCLQ
ncbi:hypothetical protein BLOT_001987 [Blomia tropicalis]|nr:hypothetical protein BLOT_001987 [Blomia tropicalis]